MKLYPDVLILGSGIAGASAALRLAQDSSCRIAVVCHRADPAEGATRYAQGGIVGRGPNDTADLLAEDILRAGAGLSLPRAVHRLAELGPSIVDEVFLHQLEIPFDRGSDGELEFIMEGAHSAGRILHSQDRTGQLIAEHLIEHLRRLPNVEILSAKTAVDLITVPHHGADPLSVYGAVTCCGAYVLDQVTGEIDAIHAPATVLATGGLGQVFRHTSNPAGARGDGFAMAYRAGARLANMEYVQFHPTTLAVRGAGNFLISEAVRGAGGRLLTPEGEPFMHRHAPEWGDLAPRDVVARAMHQEMVEGGYPHLLLDVHSVLGREEIEAEFPTIVEACREAGLDITREPIPVVPAAHYACGGVLVDGLGRTSISGLYAAGEVSCTGVHGANRLASTSLLEGLAWGTFAADDIASRNDLEPPRFESLQPWKMTGEQTADAVLITRDLESVQNTMWHYVGLSRNAARLDRARRDLEHLWQGINDFYRSCRLDDGLIGLRNAAQCAWIICQAAVRNRTSRGCHWREDGNRH